jgi:hypothetical protein
MLEILNRTRYWAYLIFFYVLKNGIQALKDNEVTIIRLFIFPIIFIGLQIASFHTTINCLIYLVGVLKSRIGSGKISREQKGVQRDVKTN